MRLMIVALVFVSSLYSSQRIIALSPAINEIVYALGMGKAVVGNTTYSLYPKESVDVAKVGGYFDVSVEKILSLDPTLVILQPNNQKLISTLSSFGIKTKVVKIDTLLHIKQAIKELGEVFDKTTKAQDIISSIEQSLQSIKHITTNQKILIVFGYNQEIIKHIYVAGQNLYFDDIIKASNNINALNSKRQGQPILDRENIIAINPDILIIIATNSKHSTKEIVTPWLDMPITASKKHHIYVLQKPYSNIPSDRIVLFINDFRKILQDATHI